MNVYMPNSTRALPVLTNGVGEQSIRAIAEGVIRVLEEGKRNMGR